MSNIRETSEIGHDLAYYCPANLDFLDRELLSKLIDSFVSTGKLFPFFNGKEKTFPLIKIVNEDGANEGFPDKEFPFDELTNFDTLSNYNT